MDLLCVWASGHRMEPVCESEQAHTLGVYTASRLLHVEVPTLSYASCFSLWPRNLGAKTLPPWIKGLLSLSFGFSDQIIAMDKSRHVGPDWAQPRKPIWNTDLTRGSLENKAVQEDTVEVGQSWPQAPDHRLWALEVSSACYMPGVADSGTQQCGPQSHSVLLAFLFRVEDPEALPLT